VVAELGTNCDLGKTITSVCQAWRCPHHIGPAASRFLPRSCCLGRSAFLGRWPKRAATLLHFLAPLPWAEPIVGPASARTPSVPSIADTTGSHVRAASFLKPTPKSPSLFATDRIHPPQSLLSLVGAPSGYISRTRAPLRFHLALSKPLWLL
jgi:hypothetical protein